MIASSSAAPPSTLPSAALPSPSLLMQTPAVPSTDEPPRGCGWFDSSHELCHGVRVIEHAGFDALMFDVPLAWQLGV